MIKTNTSSKTYSILDKTQFRNRFLIIFPYIVILLVIINALTWCYFITPNLRIKPDDHHSSMIQDDIQQQRQLQEADNGGKVQENEKFLWYQPSGRFNNQRISILEALDLGMILNRTLVIPEFSNAPPGQDGVVLHPASEYYDIDKLNELTPVIEQHEFLQRYPEEAEHIRFVYDLTNKDYIVDNYFYRFNVSVDVWGVRIFAREPFSIEKTIKVLQTAPEKTFVANQIFHVMPVDNVRRKELARYLQYNDRLWEEARKTSNELGLDPEQGYVAIHLRRGDWEHFCRTRGCFVNNEDLIAYLQETYTEHPHLKDKPLFIASNAKEDGELDSVAQYHPYIRQKERDENEDPLVSIIIDQLLCTQATVFLGTRKSTFSTTIRQERWKINPDHYEVIMEQRKKTTSSSSSSSPSNNSSKPNQ
eukprot:gb/GECH01011274.1/.p1 GENE.gb/GECH01011274.1/~~gb/GECH01011274.1/.p1  ORF type:complete len:419 (+),score=92.18 gb/GECH01011274.1/:1-1257(+)